MKPAQQVLRDQPGQQALQENKDRKALLVRLMDLRGQQVRKGRKAHKVCKARQVQQGRLVRKESPGRWE